MGLGTGDLMNEETIIWKIEAQGDVIYISGDIDAAEIKFRDSFGYVPEKLMTWTKVDELPEGEELVGEE